MCLNRRGVHCITQSMSGMVKTLAEQALFAPGGHFDEGALSMGLNGKPELSPELPHGERPKGP